MATTCETLAENFIFPASGIARRTRTRTQTGPAGSLRMSTGKVLTIDSSVIPKFAKRGFEPQRASNERQQIPFSTRHPVKDLSRLKHAQVGVNGFLTVPDPLLYPPFKTRPMIRDNTHQPQTDLPKEKDIGVKLKKEDSIKGEPKNVKARDSIRSAVPALHQTLPSSFSPGQISPVSVKPLKIAKWTGSTTTSLQAGLGSNITITSPFVSSAKALSLSERNTNIPPPTSPSGANQLLKSNKQRSRSSTPTASSLPRDVDRISAHLRSTTRVLPHQKSSSLGIFNHHSFWPREVTKLTVAKRRNRHAMAYSLDVTTTTTVDRFKRHAIYSRVGPPPVPPALIPRVGDDSLDSIIRAYHNSIVTPLDLGSLDLSMKSSQASTEGRIVHHPIMRELVREVDEALESWSRIGLF